MKDFNTMLDEYAKLIVEVGINIQEGQPLVINAPVDGKEYVRLLAKYAYKNGAKEVHINWSDDYLSRQKYENSPLELFETFPEWRKDMLMSFAEDGAGFISIYSEDPELFKDIDTEKISTANKISSEALSEFRKFTMNDINPWCVMSIPTKGWAMKVFPDLSEDEAMEKLWEKIFFATRMDLENPVERWKEHVATIKEKVKFLNKANFKKLIYKSSKGTNLEVELPKGHIWAGGGSTDSKNTTFVANMPTEEVYTMPHKDGVNGVIYSTMPLNYSGNLIDEFKLTFKDGKVVDFEAKENEDVLKDLLDMDEGAKHLGEVALVPHDSPISNLNLIFYNTLFDENASCHFAFGQAYPTNLKNGENMTKEELADHGVNDSITHVDFMVGSKDLDIIGIKQDGEEVQVFKDGNWA